MNMIKYSSGIILVLLILGSISCLSYAYDLNNDGYGDIVISNYNYNANHVLNSYVYWGDGTGSYTNKIELPTNGSYANSVTDLNSDGYLDIIFSNYYNNSSYKINSYIYWGDATASYTTKTELPTSGALGNSTADLNGDGYMDIVFSNYYSGSSTSTNSYIYWGDATASYSTKSELATHGARSSSIADLNGDGYMDIVFANRHTSATGLINSYIYWGDATASYSTKTELATQSATDSSVADFNGDGYLDIVFSNYNDDDSYYINSYIYWGDATASYTTKSELATIGALGNSVEDLNGDGYMDIVFSDYYDGSTYYINSYIYWGNSTASYDTKTELSAPGTLANAPADLNNDGYVDIIFTRFQYGGGWYATTAYIYWGDYIEPYITMGEVAILGAVGVSAGTSSAFSQTYIPEPDDEIDVIPEPLTIVLVILGLAIQKFVEIKKILR